MTNEELNKLEAKVRYSGFDRTDSTKVILDLIKLVRSITAQLDAKAIPKLSTAASFGRPFPVYGDK